MKITRKQLGRLAREMIREVHALPATSRSIETPRWMQWPVTEGQVALHNRITSDLQREAQSSLHEPDSNLGVTALLLEDSIFEWFAELEKAGAPVEKYAVWLVREISRAAHGHAAMTQQSGWGPGPGKGLAESRRGKNNMKMSKTQLRRIIQEAIDDPMVPMPNMPNLPSEKLQQAPEDVYWNDGEPVSKLIRMLQNMQTEHGDIPVKGFKADGADIEGDGYITFTVHEPDEENEEFIDKVTLGIMSN